MTRAAFLRRYYPGQVRGSSANGAPLSLASPDSPCGLSRLIVIRVYLPGHDMSSQARRGTYVPIFKGHLSFAEKVFTRYLMVDHKIITNYIKVDQINIMSESEEMYIITISGLQGGDPNMPVPLSKLANDLEVQSVSVNQMVKKLEENGLVIYAPYKGVTLTPDGQKIAKQVLRLRRLWEVFLVDKLNLSIPDAEALACRMEHITPLVVAEQLAEYLDHPVVNPQGFQIPPGMDEAYEPAKITALGTVPVGEQFTVHHIKAAGDTAEFLHSNGVVPGAVLKVLGKGPQLILIQIKEAKMQLALHLAEMVFVRTAA